VLLGLPYLEEGALRVLDDCHAPGVEHVESRRMNGGAELLGAVGRGVGTLDGDVRVPGWWRTRLALGLHLWRDRRDILATDLHHRVDHVVADRIVDRLPAEQLAVELLGRGLVCGGQVGPREGPWCVFGSFSHDRRPYPLPDTGV
jgi:hypothetical protein